MAKQTRGSIQIQKSKDPGDGMDRIRNTSFRLISIMGSHTEISANPQSPLELR